MPMLTGKNAEDRETLRDSAMGRYFNYLWSVPGSALASAIVPTSMSTSNPYDAPLPRPTDTEVQRFAEGLQRFADDRETRLLAAAVNGLLSGPSCPVTTPQDGFLPDVAKRLAQQVCIIVEAVEEECAARAKARARKE